MDAPAALLAMKMLVLDTFRQARGSGILWLMLGVTLVCVGVCLSVTAEGDVPMHSDDPHDRPETLPRSDLVRTSEAVAMLVADRTSQALGVWTVPPVWYSTHYKQVSAALHHGVPVARGKFSLGFGAFPVDLARDRHHSVRSLQTILAGWVADSVGLLLALTWTAGFLPAFLKPAAASVLLAKPVPRWSLLIGKYLGGLAFVAAQGAVFVAGTWLALAVRTNVWDPTWFLCLPLLLLHFSVFYAFSALLAVTTRSTVVCVFGSVLFWVICWAMNYGRHVAQTLPELQHLQGVHFLSEVGYWILPKPLDFHLILVQTLQASEFAGRVIDVNRLAERGAWCPELSVASSLAAGLLLLGLAGYEFVNTDY